MTVTEAQAVEAARHLFQGLGPGDRVVGRKIDGSTLWGVNAVDEQGMPWPGAFILVGPDLRVWSFSSNPSIHKSEIVLRVLDGIYAAGASSAVEPGLLMDRVATATSAFDEACRAIVQDAESGSLRGRGHRQLP